MNEGLAGLNKYVVGFSDANSVRTYHNVRVNEIDNSAGTILATEWVDEWGIVSGVNRGGGTGVIAKAHRPVNPWRIAGTGVGDKDKDPAAVAYLPDVPVATLLRKSNATDLWRVSGGGQSLDIVKDYQAGNYTPATRGSRLDFVGRNHYKQDHAADNKTNFLYVDGHVETKSVLDTIPKDQTVGTPWEWGKLPYSLAPNKLDPTVP